MTHTHDAGNRITCLSRLYYLREDLSLQSYLHLLLSEYLPADF